VIDKCALMNERENGKRGEEMSKGRDEKLGQFHATCPPEFTEIFACTRPSLKNTHALFLASFKIIKITLVQCSTHL
jgi:hypothetical protein